MNTELSAISDFVKILQVGLVRVFPPGRPSLLFAHLLLRPLRDVLHDSLVLLLAEEVEVGDGRNEEGELRVEVVCQSM